MVLESCMILLDRSEFMRNGDYIPSRLEAQIDAANVLIGAKTNSHPESTVGVVVGTELMVSPTQDVAALLRAVRIKELKQVEDVISAVQVASLALKHRPNKNGAQRIVLFVGTPVTAEARQLQKAGRQLKKNNVAIDVVIMGEVEENEAKLQELVDAANGRAEEERTCHLVTIPAGVLPSDVLANSPILGGQGAFAASAAAAAAVAGGGVSDFADFGGVDPNMDPELAMALRISMEEERARQERAAAAAAAAAATTSTVASESKDAEMTDVVDDMGLSEEEALLQQALAMSMNENEPDSKPSAIVESMDMDQDEDAALQMALQMSMQQAESGQQFQDPSFVNELLGSASGVDPNDPDIQEALRKAKEGDDEDKKDEDKKE